LRLSGICKKIFFNWIVPSGYNFRLHARYSNIRTCIINGVFPDGAVWRGITLVIASVVAPWLGSSDWQCQS